MSSDGELIISAIYYGRNQVEMASGKSVTAILMGDAQYEAVLAFIEDAKRLGMFHIADQPNQLPNPSDQELLQLFGLPVKRVEHPDYLLLDTTLP